MIECPIGGVMLGEQWMNKQYNFMMPIVFLMRIARVSFSRILMFCNQVFCILIKDVAASPFLQLNLNHDQWRLHMQSVADVGVKGSLSKESYSLLIEIRMEKYQQRFIIVTFFIIYNYYLFL